jgi:hypothetical protein
MKGRINSLKLGEDRKGNAYAVAKVAGEDIYTWDKGLIETLQGLGDGAGISYELADKGDFKFEKFKSLEAAEVPPEPSPRAQPDHIRFFGSTEIKARSTALDIAARQLEGSDLKYDKKHAKTMEYYKDYMKLIGQGYEDLFDAIRPIKDEDSISLAVF